MENIKVSVEKYSTFLNKYKELHEYLLRNIAYCEDELKELLHTEGRFHATETSKTIEEILEVWDEMVKTHLGEGFDKMEQSVYHYINFMQEADNI